jgi:hypothetical protein
MDGRCCIVGPETILHILLLKRGIVKGLGDNLLDSAAHALSPAIG